MTFECRNELESCLARYRSCCSRFFQGEFTLTFKLYEKGMFSGILRFTTIIPSDLLNELYSLAKKYNLLMWIGQGFIHFH